MSRARILTGDALAMLRTLPAGSARTCVTSPPYWGLRDYGTGRWEGGDPACLHRRSELRRGVNLAASAASTRGGAKKVAEVGWLQHRNVCPCGALRVDEQVGLEATPEAYVARLVAIFDEVARVLTGDGTLWLNLGDSYCGDPGGFQGKNLRKATRTMTARIDMPKHGSDLKPKDLVGVPWMAAFALRRAGWYLRSEIIWEKPNPMPESVIDRPTKAHETLFLLSKAERYHYNAAAIEEPASENERTRRMREQREGLASTYELKRDDESHGQAAPGRNGVAKSIRRRHELATKGTRNARTVWRIATQPYPGAHFAAFPEKLARRCILAGSAPGDTVLDPFAGSGTVGQVATGTGRSAVLIELNPDYVRLARLRIGALLCEDR